MKSFENLTDLVENYGKIFLKSENQTLLIQT